MKIFENFTNFRNFGRITDSRDVSRLTDIGYRTIERFQKERCDWFRIRKFNQMQGFKIVQ